MVALPFVPPSLRTSVESKYSQLGYKWLTLASYHYEHDGKHSNVNNDIVIMKIVDEDNDKTGDTNSGGGGGSGGDNDDDGDVDDNDG